MSDEKIHGRQRVGITVSEVHGNIVTSVRDHLTGKVYRRIPGTTEIGSIYNLSRLLKSNGDPTGFCLYARVLREVDMKEPLALIRQRSISGLKLASGRWYEIHAD